MLTSTPRHHRPSTVDYDHNALYKINGYVLQVRSDLREEYAFPKTLLGIRNIAENMPRNKGSRKSGLAADKSPAKNSLGKIILLVQSIIHCKNLVARQVCRGSFI